MKKNSLDSFIEKSRKIHGDKYDYSKVNYVNTHTKVCIICPEHGEFWQTPHGHLSGYGCAKCNFDRQRKRNLWTTQKFIEEARKVHGDKYDYSKSEYVNCNEKICIICPKHGEFWQTPIYHINGKGNCPECYNERRGESKRLTAEDYIKQAKNIHGDKFNYDKTNYINSRTKLIVTCPTHGDVEIMPGQHIRILGGCFLCSKEILKEEKIRKEKIKIIQKEKIKENREVRIKEKENKFIETSGKIHGDKYDYSKVNFVNSQTKVCIICSEHGEFWQTPHNHINGCGCPTCAKEKLRRINSDTKEIFIEKARKIHGDRYDYSKVEYIDSKTKVCIICPKHGEFWQTPSMHASEGQGCPNCAALSSKDEKEIINFINSKDCNLEIINRDNTILNGKELDILIPSKNISIEYNGLRWHSEQFNKDKYYHLNKTEQCKNKNIRLIHIFEDEWVYKKDIVKNKISHILQLDNNKKKIFARKCEIKEIDKDSAKKFLESFHIQGYTISSKFIGAFSESKLIGVMSFLKSKNNEWILNRFSTDYNYICSGVGGKIFNFFIRKYNPYKITTFADRRWCLNEKDNLYTKIGFELEKILSPDYHYVTSTNSYRIRYHKFLMRKKNLIKKYGDSLINENMTESEMTEKLKFYKIWDCGLYKYVWKNH